MLTEPVNKITDVNNIPKIQLTTTTTTPTTKKTNVSEKRTSAERTGLVLPISRIRRRFMKTGLHCWISPDAVVYATAAIEYVLMFWMQVALKCMDERSEKKKTMKPRHLDQARLADANLKIIFNPRFIHICHTTGIHL